MSDFLADPHFDEAAGRHQCTWNPILGKPAVLPRRDSDCRNAAVWSYDRYDAFVLCDDCANLRKGDPWRYGRDKAPIGFDASMKQGELFESEIPDEMRSAFKSGQQSVSSISKPACDGREPLAGQGQPSSASTSVQGLCGLVTNERSIA